MDFDVGLELTWTCLMIKNPATLTRRKNVQQGAGLSAIQRFTELNWLSQVSVRPSIIALKSLSKAYIRRQSEKVPIWFPVLWLRTPCDSTADNGKSPIQRINHHFISPGTSSAQNKFLSCLLLISLFSCVHIIRGRLIDGVSKRANNTYTQWLRWVT